VSAGLDCQLIVNTLSGSKSKTNKTLRISPIPQQSVVHSIPNSCSLLLQYTDHLELWRLGSTLHNSDVDGEQLELKTGPVKQVDLRAKLSGSEIVCSAVSRCGAWVVYSDEHSLKLYNVGLEEMEGVGVVPRVTRVRCLPPTVVSAGGAVCLAFTPDSSTLVIAGRLDSSVHLVKLDPVEPRLVKSFVFDQNNAATHILQANDKTAVSCMIHLLAVSGCGQYLAVASLNKTINIYHLTLLQHVVALPVRSHQPTAMSFSSTSPSDLLVIAYSDNKIVEYSVSCKEYTAWSRKHTDYRHAQWSTRINKIRRITYHPLSANQIIAHDDEMFCIINKTQAMPDSTVRLFPCTSTQGSVAKKRDSSGQAPHALHICDRFKYLLHMDVMPDGLLVVVERPQLSLVESLPAPFRQHKFGV